MGEMKLKKQPQNTKRRTTKRDAPLPRKAVFPFFDLPRELRDKIYEDALTFKRKFGSQHGARIRARQCPATNLLLVCHAFKAELLDRAERTTCLVVTDRGIYHGERLKLPTPVNFAPILEVYLATCCEAPTLHGDRRHPCSVIREMRMHRKWIEDLAAQMKAVKSIKIEIMLDPHSLVAGCEEALLGEQFRLTNFDEKVVPLRELEVFHSSHYVSEGVWSFNRPRKLVMRWDGVSGEVKRVQVKEEKPVVVAIRGGKAGGGQVSSGGGQATA